MFRDLLKFISILSLFSLLISPQNLYAQSEDDIIAQYLKGNLIITTHQQKEIISDYLSKMNPSKSVSLIRPDNPRAIIFSEDFTGQVLPAGWTNVDNLGGSALWEFNNPGARTITGSGFDADFAILDSDNYGSGNSQDATLTTTPIDASGLASVFIGFDHQFRYLSGSYGILDISVDGSTWTNIDTLVANAGYPNPAVYTEYDVTSIAAGQSTVYFRWTYIGSYDWWWAIDNVVVYEPAATPNPAVVVGPSDGAIDVNINTVLEWSSNSGTAPTGYRINFGTDNPPTNIENNTDLGLVTTYTPGSALSYSTTYYWEIIPYNASGDATGTVVWSFTTMDDPTVSTFPYAQNFDNGGVIPDGWQQDPGNSENWLFGTSTTYAASGDHTSGSGYIAYIDDSSPYNAYPAGLLSPPFDITGLTAPTASFWYWIGVGNAGPSYINIDISTDAGATWTDSVITALVENNQWDEVTIDLTSYSSAALMLRFSGYENLSNYTCDISIDDFTVEDAVLPPGCALNVSPADGGTNISSLTDLVWSSGGGAPTGYILYFGTDGGGVTPPTNIENGTDLGNTTTYDPIANLNYSTTYYWQVIAYNSNGQSSGCDIWSFTTEPDPTIVTFPWNDDLETPGAPGTPDGWTQDVTDDFDWTFDAGGTPSSLTGPSIDHNPGTSTGTYGFTESSTNYGNTANIQTPPLDLTGLTNPVFSFWYHMYGSTMGTLSVDYTTDGGTTWTNGWSLSGDQGDVWYNAEIGLPTNANFVRFSGLTGTNFYSDMAFDDVTIYDNVSPPNCAINVSPPDGAVSISVYTDLTWEDGGGGTTGYLLYFGTDGGGITPPTNLVNGDDLGNVLTYDYSGVLTPGTIYYWQIVPYNANGNSTGCAIWSFTTYPDAPLSGTYTVGLNEFINRTGKKVYFEERTRTVTKNLNGDAADEDLNAVKEDQTESKIKITPDLSPKYVEVTETYMELMENGKPFDRNFYLENPLGVYPTITEAVNDLNARGVSGPVTFELVDNNYPSETYPILIGDVGGISSTNTVTIKPGSGIQTVIPGDPAQPTSTIQIGYGDWIIVDGSNNSTTTKDLTVVGQNGAPAVHFYGDASNNVVKNIVAESNNISTGSGVMIFGTGGFDCDNNLIENCTVKNIDGDPDRPGVGVYFFSSQTGDGNQVVGCDIYDFDDYGIRLQGAPSTNILVSGCDVHMTDNASTSTTYGAYVSRVEGLIIQNSKFYNFAGGTVKGIYIAGNSTSGDFVLRNNFVSLANSSNNSGILAGIDYFGYAANSFEAYFNSVYLGGSDVTGTSITYAFTKRDDADVYKAYNNAVYNSRSNGTGTGSHYAIYISDTNTVTLEVDYNDFYADGTGGEFGYYQGFVDIANLTEWQDSTGLDANSLSADPGFIGGDDLHILPYVSTLDGSGVIIPSVPQDIDGDTRGTPPDIGADEYPYDPTAVVNPSNVTATAINFDQIDVGFTPNGSSDNVVIVFSLDENSFIDPLGPPPPIGQPFAGGTLIANTITSPYSHTGLTGLTTYYYKLFSYDGVDYSVGVAASATTPRAPVTNYPYVQNFDSGLNDGWEQDPNNTEDWQFGTSTTYAASQDHTSGTGGIAYIDDSSPYNAFPSGLISCELDVSGLTAPTLSFWYWIGTGNAGTSYLNVDVSTDGGVTWTDSVMTALVENSQWDHVIFDLTPYSSASTKIRFNGFESQIDFDCDISIDDFEIYEFPTIPLFGIDPTAKDFGFAFNGTSSADQTFTISNVGGGTLTINAGGITLEGTDADQFVLTDGNTYPINLGFGESTTVDVNFSPTSTGVKNAELQIVDNTTDATQTAPLTGYASPLPFAEGFDGFVAGQQAACQDPLNWTTWTYDPCNATEDPYISTVQAFSGANSVVIVPDNDFVKPLGNQTTGVWNINFMAYIATGKAGYFNTLAQFEGGSGTNVWGMECYFNVGGAGELTNVPGEPIAFTYPLDTWFPVSVVVDFGQNPTQAELTVNSVSVLAWDWTQGGTIIDQLAANDFFGATVDDEMYFDDYQVGMSGGTTFALSVPIEQGWNMVSVPGINPDGMGVTDWWSNLTGTVYEFVPGSGYNGITTTATGEGYWLKNSVTETYTYPAIQIVTHDPIGAITGWNMFGGYEDIVPVTSLTTTPPGQIVSVYKFIPGTGYQAAAQLEPGYGYWVKVSSDCQINIPDALAKGLPKIAEMFKDDWGKITLTDASGSSYTLYTVKGEVDLNKYELPPLPPSGIFDARYESGRVAEDINTAAQSVEMRGMTYPVKVKVDGIDIRIQDVTGKEINMNLKSGEEISIRNSNIDKIMVSGELIPDRYSLEQNYPNPFNPVTTIEFSLPENVKNVRISIYNVLGEKVSELVNGEMLAGKYQYQWDAKNFASGMYIYELRTDKFVSVKKMMLLK